MAKLWDRGGKSSDAALDYATGKDYILDQALVPYDCRASEAHAEALWKAGVLTASEKEKITGALEDILKLHAEGRFVIKKEDEDCHTAIENFLTEKLGDTGKKVHALRSRNDQVLTALRLYYKDELSSVLAGIDAFIAQAREFSARHGKVAMPGYTHTRKAMPSSARLWTGAFIASMEDDKKIVRAALELVDQSPLGTGAGYGLPAELDRKLTAKKLGFSSVQENPLYVQNSRGKFEGFVLHALSQVMLDLSRMASDVILFSMPELGYFTLDSSVCTGSSIMPQKKNPDVLEIMRGKFHEVQALGQQVMGTTAGLISGYNRDVQLTKEPVMKGFSIVKESLAAAALVLSGMGVDAEKCRKAMTPELFAAQEAYELSMKGVPFRDAYRKVAGKFMTDGDKRQGRSG
ncbi:MAG: argininosuccinate lyase [Candidatus Aenigmatarchaeota archaeon]